MNQLNTSTSGTMLSQTVRLSQTMLVWITLSAFSFCQQPTATSPPVANSTTMLIIGLDAELAKNGFASESDFLKAVSPGTSAYMSFDAPFGRQHPFGRAVFKSDRRIENHRVTNEGGLTIVADEPDRVHVGGDPPTDSQTRRIRAAETSIQRYPIRILLVPPEYVSDTFEQALPILPESMGSIPTRILTRGIRWAALGVNPVTQKLEAMFQSASPEDAKALATVLPKLLSRGLPFMQNLALMEFTTMVDKGATLRVVESQVHVTFERMDSEKWSTAMNQLAAALLGAEQLRQRESKLRKIQLAILNYEAANGCFPPRENMRGDDGKSGLSWRVHILPYLGDKEAKLYSDFRLNEPWDSTHNKQLLVRIPDCYQRSDSWLKTGTPNSDTVYLAPVGSNTVLGTDAIVRFKDITDGSSLTLAVVEVDANSGVPWTAPKDYQYDEIRPAAKLAFSKKGVGLGVACDGTVHELKKDWNAAKYLRLFQRDDGRPVRW